MHVATASDTAYHTMQSSPLHGIKRGAVLGVLASGADTDTDSQLSYASGAKSIKPVVKVVWKGGKKVTQSCTCGTQPCMSSHTTTYTVSQVDEENFLHMKEEYYRLKQTEKANEETMRQ